MNAQDTDWTVAGTTTLNGYEDDLPYLVIRANTDDEGPRNVALVGAWDLAGQEYAQLIAAAPKLLAACQAVVERWEQGDLAEAARLCSAAVAAATGA